MQTLRVFQSVNIIFNFLRKVSVKENNTLKNKNRKTSRETRTKTLFRVFQKLLFLFLILSNYCSETSK